jgi:DNA-binding NarL/FixJ family response regulator
LLVDDHSLFRESLSRLLQTESDFQIAGTCASASEALALPHLDKVDVVLLDYDLGHEQGTLFLDRARSAGFAGRILMVGGVFEAQSPQPVERGHPKGDRGRGLARPGSDALDYCRGHR